MVDIDRAWKRSLALAMAFAVVLAWVGVARADHIVAIRGGAPERYTPGVGWVAMPTPVHVPMDGIAYDGDHHAYVVSVGEPGLCSFVEFAGERVIGRMTQAQFRRAAHTSLTANCELHPDPAGGVLISASAETLGSETSWSVNIVSKRATYLGYGYAATSDGHHVVLVQHTYFPPPVLGSAELLAAGRWGLPDTLQLIVPMSMRFTWTDPALSLSGKRFAAVRNSTLVTGPLGGPLLTLQRLPQDTVLYDLQWSDSGRDLVALAGPEAGVSGRLLLINPGNGHEQTLATSVTGFAATP